ncbi:MAG: rhomboid family intramembrane serine protease [Planctomycetota bacterium]|nr:MAG: rhomboid family intramembrane serine protease [Planctomycetota bacterium]
MKIRLKYNSPLILSYTFFCLLIVLLSTFLFGENKMGGLNDIQIYFSVGGGFDWSHPVAYFRLFSHIAGHADFPHFFGNFMLILLLGPILEEKYGWKLLLFMILVTAFLTGLIQTIFLSGALLGASGIVFLLIVLSSLMNFKTGDIPITFILVTLLYVGKEFFSAAANPNDGISHFAHILGGICGGVFGFLEGRKDVDE